MIKRPKTSDHQIWLSVELVRVSFEIVRMIVNMCKCLIIPTRTIRLVNLADVSFDMTMYNTMVNIASTKAFFISYTKWEAVKNTILFLSVDDLNVMSWMRKTFLPSKHWIIVDCSLIWHMLTLLIVYRMLFANITYTAWKRSFPTVKIYTFDQMLY